LLDRFEAHLSTTEYVAGKTLTMADIPMACEIHRWFGLNLPSKSRPHIEDWYAKMLARPGSKNVFTLPLS
jgi:glutathione S-transferase